MRYVRYMRNGQLRDGIIEQDRVLEIAAPGDKEGTVTGRSHEINDLAASRSGNAGQSHGVG